MPFSRPPPLTKFSSCGRPTAQKGQAHAQTAGQRATAVQHSCWGVVVVVVWGGGQPSHPILFELRKLDLAIPAWIELRHRRVQLLLSKPGAHHLDQRTHLIAIERPGPILRAGTRCVSECFGWQGSGRWCDGARAHQPPPPRLSRVPSIVQQHTASVGMRRHVPHQSARMPAR